MSAAEDRPTCPTCGKALTGDAPEGLCAKCVVDVMMNFAALDLGPSEEDVDDEVTLLEATAQFGQVGDYEILEKIAAGGMGVVYRARQKSLGRMVALKLVAEGKLAGETDKERFLLEARAAGELDHPNILPIYEVGEDDGQYFFSMPLVTGGSLSDWLDMQSIADRGKSGTSLSGNFRDGQIAAAKLLQKIAHAVHYAHVQGILHRDLKPANILIDHHGEPQISDFGLAKRVAEDTHLTVSGQLLGSPAYMSPEQAQGKNHELTPAADTYAIGAMLYQALTGILPFDGDSPMALLQETLTKEPKPLRHCNPRIDRDLETITLCCLEKVPGDRYASAEALADDLGRWLDGKPIQARPAGWTRRSMKWVRRKPSVAAAVGIALLGILVIAGLTWRHQKATALKSLADYPEDVRLANEHLDLNEPKEARAILAKQAPSEREFAWAWLSKRIAALGLVDVGQGQAQALLPSIAAPGNVLIQSPAGLVRRWDLESPMVEEDFEVGGPPSRDVMRFDGGRTFLLSRNSEEQEQWRLVLPAAKRRDGRLASKLVPPVGGFLAAAPGNRPSLFVQTSGKRGDSVFTWSPPWVEGLPRFELSDDLQALAISPKSQKQERYYVAVCYRTRIELWQWEEEVFFRKETIQRSSSPSAAVAFSPNGRLLFVGDASGMIRGWNRRSLEVDLEWQHSGAVQTMTTVDQDGVHHLVASNAEGELRAWPLLSEALNIARKADLPIGFSEDGAWIVYWERDSDMVNVRSIRRARSEPLGRLPTTGTLVALALLETEPPVALAIMLEENGRLSGARITKEGTSAALEAMLSSIPTDWVDQSVSGYRWFLLRPDGSAQIVDLRTGQIEERETVGKLSGEKVRIFGGDTALCSSVEGNLITMCERSSAKRRVTLAGDSPAVCYAVSPDRKTLAVSHADEFLRLWHGESGKLLLKLSSHPWEFLQFSPTGETLVGYESSGQLHFWDSRQSP